jgi:hypothetical protein
MAPPGTRRPSNRPMWLAWTEARLRGTSNRVAHSFFDPRVQAFVGVDRDPSKQVKRRAAAAAGKRGKCGFGARDVVFLTDVGRCFTTAILPRIVGRLLLLCMVHLVNLCAVCAEMMRVANPPVDAIKLVEIGSVSCAFEPRSCSCQKGLPSPFRAPRRPLLFREPRGHQRFNAREAKCRPASGLLGGSPTAPQSID